MANGSTRLLGSGLSRLWSAGIATAVASLTVAASVFLVFYSTLTTGPLHGRILSSAPTRPSDTDESTRQQQQQQQQRQQSDPDNDATAGSPEVAMSAADIQVSEEEEVEEQTPAAAAAAAAGDDD